MAKLEKLPDTIRRYSHKIDWKEIVLALRTAGEGYCVSFGDVTPQKADILRSNFHQALRRNGLFRAGRTEFDRKAGKMWLWLAKSEVEE